MSGSRLRFEWDEVKARRNLRKHGVSFDEAVTVFEDPLALTVGDPDHSEDEQQYLYIGLSTEARLLVVIYAERAGTIRLVSSRRATGRERKLYEEEPT